VRPSVEIRFFLDGDQRVEAREAERARGIVLAGRAAEGGGPALARLAIQELDPLGNLTQGNDVPALEQLAVAAMIARDPRRGLASWQRIVEIAPYRDQALRSLAMLQRVLGNTAASLEFCDRAIRVNPDLPETYWLKAEVLEQTGRLSEAAAAAEMALARDPSATPVRLWLVKTYERLGKTAEARQQQQTLERLRQVSRPASAAPGAVGGRSAEPQAN
jgi:tetratricopeptide (TPR) repeat protein